MGLKLAALETATVHIVGAATQEWYVTQAYNEISHLMPALKELNIVLVGPQLNDQLNSAEVVSARQADIDAHVRKTCKLTVNTFKGLYHEYVASGEGPFAWPTLVFAMHSGIHDANDGYTETWEPTISLLSSTDVPCVFTSYTELEAKLDTETLRAMGANVIVEPHLNPFRGLRPLAEPFGGLT